MVIVYADDEQSAQAVVSRALQLRGHTVFTLDTSNPAQLQADTARLLKFVKSGLQVDVFVLDGHNRLTDDTGRLVTELTPDHLVAWLYHNGLGENCTYILFSNDHELVWQAHRAHAPFAAAISKVGQGGGLGALLDSIERVGRGEPLTS